MAELPVDPAAMTQRDEPPPGADPAAMTQRYGQGAAADPAATQSLSGAESPGKTIKGDGLGPARAVEAAPTLRSAATITFPPETSSRRRGAARASRAALAAAPGRGAIWDFHVLREIGRGGMGVVYAARQASLARDVALKMIRPDHAPNPSEDARFMSEALVTGDLDHPNIVPVHDLGRDARGNLYMAMKLVRGTSWDELLHPRDPPPAGAGEDAERARAVAARGAAMGFRDHLTILLKVCDAIAFAHARGIIHRDLKPENVMVGDYGEVVVMDWGLALDVSDDARRARKAEHKSAVGSPAGTPRYMAPEQALVELDLIGRATDVYLLGGTLYEILTGTQPHRGDDVVTVLRTAATGEIEPPDIRAPEREIPEMLAEIATRALALEPKDRFASVAEFAAAIGEYLKNEASLQISATALDEVRRTEAAIALGKATPTSPRTSSTRAMSGTTRRRA